MIFAVALLILLLVGIASAVSGGIKASRRHQPDPGVTPEPERTDGPGILPARIAGRPHQRRAVDPRLGIQLDHWVAAGLLSPEQADAIARHEQERRPSRPAPATATTVSGPLAAAPTGRRRIPVVAEALGYIGGILGIVGLVLLVGRYWEDMGTGTRLGLAGAAAFALVFAGWVVHEAVDPAFARLRWTLWLASTVATGLFAFVLAEQALGIEPDGRVALIVAAAMGAESAVLWWNRPRPVQQITTLGGLAVATALLVDQFAGEIVTGAVVWMLGAAVLVLGLRRLTTLPIITLAAGAITTVVGTIFLASAREGVGLPLLCLDAAVLIALAVVSDTARDFDERIVLAIVGILALLQGVPQTIVWFSDQAGIATGLVVWAVGAALLTVAARRSIHAAIAIEVVGSVAMIGGAAITGTQSAGFATVFGISTAIGFVMLGMLPGRVLMSLFGSAGLLVFVPWTIAHYFPGQDRAPLLILVSGALLVAIAVLLTRQGKRFRRELTGPETRSEFEVGTGPTGSRPASEARGVDIDAEEHPTEGLVQPR